MTREAEYALEQERLQIADRDIADGEIRVSKQRLRLLDLDRRSPDLALAEHMLAALESNLASWYEHRRLILERLDYLASAPDASRHP